MKNFELYSGKKLSDGKIVTGELIVYYNFFTAIIVPIEAANISYGDRVNYFSLNPLNPKQT